MSSPPNFETELEKIGTVLDNTGRFLITTKSTSLKKLMQVLDRHTTDDQITIKIPEDAKVTREDLQQWLLDQAQQVKDKNRWVFLQLSQSQFHHNDWYPELGRKADLVQIRPNYGKPSEEALIEFVDWLQELHDKNKLPPTCWINLQNFPTQTEAVAKKFEALLSSPGMVGKKFMFELDTHCIAHLVPSILKAQTQTGPKLDLQFGYITPELTAKEEWALIRHKQDFPAPNFFTYSYSIHPLYESFHHKSDQFYIALCKQRGKHNLMSIGCIQEDGTAIPCLGAGLLGIKPKNSQNLSWSQRCAEFLKAHFTPSKYAFKSERLSMLPPEQEDSEDEKPQAFTYKAFTLNREQFIDAVENTYAQLHKRSKIKAYLPSKQDPSLFTWQYIENWILEQRNQDESYLNTLLEKSNHTAITPFNTCRQVAQSGVEQSCQLRRDDWGKGVFRKFFFSLPFSTVMKPLGDRRYQTMNRFVVFPKPCHVTEFSVLRKQIMNRLELVALDHSELGQLKFNTWKSLYLTLSPAKSSDLEAIKSDIKTWLNQDLEFMTNHRNLIMRTLFPKVRTKSAKLVEAVQQELTSSKTLQS